MISRFLFPHHMLMVTPHLFLSCCFSCGNCCESFNQFASVLSSRTQSNSTNTSSSFGGFNNILCMLQCRFLILFHSFLFIVPMLFNMLKYRFISNSVNPFFSISFAVFHLLVHSLKDFAGSFELLLLNAFFKFSDSNALYIA